MRAALGLPQPERRIGQSAHDFAAAFVADKKVDPQALLTARFAPDMYDFAKQVRVASTWGVWIAGRLAGGIPVFRTEHTIHYRGRHSALYPVLEPLATALTRRVVCVRRG